MAEPVGDLSPGHGEQYFNKFKSAPERLPAAIASKEGKFGRTEVLTSFNNAYALCEASAKSILTDNHLPADIVDRWKRGETLTVDEERGLQSLSALEKKKLSDYKIISDGKRLTLDSNKDTFTHAFTATDGKNYTPEEGIPVEGLLNFLRAEIDSLHAQVANGTMRAEDAQRKIIELNGEGYVLYKASRSVGKYRVKYGADASEGTPAHARAQAEARYISQDVLRTTGNNTENFYRGIQTMQYRRELHIPADDTVDTTPITPSSPTTAPATSLPTGGAPSVPLSGTAPSGDADSVIRDGGLPSPINPGEHDDDIDESADSSSTPLPAPIAATTSSLPAAPVNPVGSSPDESAAAPAEASSLATPEATTSTPSSISEVRREFHIVNRTVDVRKKAAEIAEQQLRAEMRRGKWWNPKDIFRKIKLRMAEEFYRQQYKERAVKAMLENDNSYLDFDCVKNAVRDANKNREGQKKAGQMKIAEVKAQEALGNAANVKEAQGALKTEIIEQIIKPLVDGSKTEGEIRVLLKTFVESHATDPDVQALFGRDATKYREIADFFASDLGEMAQKVKEDIATHQYALDAIDQHISIKLANAEWGAQTDAHFNAMDKLVAKVQGHKLLGWMINPATAGAIGSLASFGGMRLLGAASRTANVIAPGVGSFLGGTVGGIRRWHDLTVDIASHKAEKAYGLQTPVMDARQREKIDKILVLNTASVADLLTGGGVETTTGERRESIDTLLKLDLTVEANQLKVIQRIAEISTRIDMSQVLGEDFVTAQGSRAVLQQLGSVNEEEGLDIGRSELVVQVAKMRIALRAAGITENKFTELHATEAIKWRKLLAQNKDQEKKAERVYKLKEAVKAAVVGGTVGLVSSLATQEVTAVVERGLGMSVGETNLEGLYRRAAGTLAGERHIPAPTTEVMMEAFGKGGVVDVNNHLQLQVDPNTHVAQLLDSGKAIPGMPKMVEDQYGNIRFEGTGTIPQNIQDELKKIGFHSYTEAGSTLLDPAAHTNEVMVGVHKTVIPDGTKWVTDTTSGKLDLVVANDPSKILIHNAEFAQNGAMSYDSATSMIKNAANISYTEAGPSLLSSTTSTTEVFVDGHKTIVPIGTEWVKDSTSGKLDLVVTADHSKVLVNDAVFKNDGTMTSEAGGLSHVDTVDSTIKISGPEGIWTKDVAHLDKYEWYGNNTPYSDYNELAGKTYLMGDKVRISMYDMKDSWQKGLTPESINVPEAYKRLLGDGSRTGVAFSLGGHAKEPLILLTDRNGYLDLNPNAAPNEMIDYVDSNGNVGQISLRTVSQALLNVDKIKQLGLKDGDIATEYNAVYKNPDYLNIWKIGGTDGKETGYFSTGRFVIQNGKKVWQSFATARGMGAVPTEIGDKVPSIKGVDINTTQELFKPEIKPISIRAESLVFEPPLEAPAAIPIPIIPRWPLEQLLLIYGYGGGEFGHKELGLLDWGEFKKRQSPTIKNNPDAQLNERTELDYYFNSQNPEYIKEIKDLNGTDVMSENCRVAITIPAYQEGKNIRKTLEQFTKQKDKDGNALSSDLFEIVIVDNHPASKTKDNTEAEIQAFVATNPQIKVKYAHKTWINDEGGVGIARKYATDLALMRSKLRSNQTGDLILVSQDADLEGLSDNYIIDMVHAFDSNLRVDAVAGKWTLSDKVLSKPNVRAAERLWHFLDRLIQNDAVGPTGSRDVKTPGLVGRNAAFRASIFAAVGGYNNHAKLAEDLEIGWMMQAARNMDASRQIYLNSAEVVSSPRRFLAATVQGTPLIQMYGGFHENTGIRQLDDNKLLSQISDTFDAKRFEKEADAIWQAHMNGQYKWLGDRFVPLFRRSMGLVGVDYQIVNGHVKILDYQKLLNGLNKNP